MPTHSAEILSQGDEVVTGQTVDTNAAWISERLTELGFMVLRHTAVGDRLEDIRDLVRDAAARSSLCICTGGLGPTEDDLTAQAVAEAFDRPLRLDSVALEHIAGFFKRVNRPMSVVNRKQAYLPEGAIRLNNHWGTAPGFAIEQGHSWLAFLPGVPREMKQMVSHRVEPLLCKRFHLEPSRLITFRTVGVGESTLQEQIGPFNHPVVTLSYRTMHPENQVKLRFPGNFPDNELQTVVQDIASRIGSSVFATEGLDEPGGSLVEVVARQMQSRQERIALLEISTGGHLTATCSALNGQSDWLARSIVLGPRDPLHEFGVPAHLLGEHGPVSAPVACALAQSIRKRTGATYGLATTGIEEIEKSAGDRSTGIVFVALATPKKTHPRQLLTFGDPSRIQRMGTAESLDLLRREFANMLD